MNKRILYSLLVILVSASPVLACYPDPEISYDEVSSEGMLIAIAAVDTVELENVETHVCWRIGYSNAQYLFGLGEKDFSVRTCSSVVS